MQLPALSCTETSQKISREKPRESGNSTAGRSVLTLSGNKELIPGSEHKV